MNTYFRLPKTIFRIIFFIFLILANHSYASYSRVTSDTVPPSSSFPLQVELKVLHAPIPFPSNGKNHLMYELYVTNYENQTITLDHLTVQENTKQKPVLKTFSGLDLNKMSKQAGKSMFMGTHAIPIKLAPSNTLLLFIELDYIPSQLKSRELIHTLFFADGRKVIGVPMKIKEKTLKVLAPPVSGSHWIAADAPGNPNYNHHWRGVFVINGQLQDSRRFAIDWKQLKEGKSYKGDKNIASSYYAYGKSVLAVANAKVVLVQKGYPDNPPGHNENFHPTIPITFDNAGGNTIVLDLGNGQYAHYYHLKPNSINVKVGQQVKKGQIIGRIGASGDAREPHLHFSVTTEIPLLYGEGIPYVIDNYRSSENKEHTSQIHKNELPIYRMLIDFSNK
ncbi:M23 family metallopeptidase [Zhouia sp. PK063]|uniref:M23 family metallopeptidase n=1 Tax=Zhouia sp. PK063 TaxID=3373602 RepID=UPI0037BD5AF1